MRYQLITLGLLFALPLWAQPLGYLPAGTPEIDGIRHLALIYHGMKTRPVWNKQNLLPYVAYVNEQGEPQDWLFDAFLFIEFGMDDGVWIHHYQKDKRLPTVGDWTALSDGWFRAESGLIGLEQAVAEVAAKLNDPGHKVPVVITLPVPLTEDTAFGPLPGETETLNFTKVEDRQRALTWYIDQVVKRFADGDYPHLKLAGFYWTAETIPAEERPLVTWVSSHLKARQLNHYWIPYFGARGLREWRSLGFAGTMLQPNYFFSKETMPLNRFLIAAKLARLCGSGIEIEFDGRAVGDEEFYKRMLAYFDAGVYYGWMGKTMLGYYEGGGGVGQIATKPGRGRELYQKLYEFIKGTYKPSGLHDFSAFPIVTRDNSQNLALASRGAKISGAPKRPEWGEDIGPEKLNDGDIDFYGGMSGFGAFYIPNGFAVELPKPTTVARTQTMFFDYDSRSHNYRIDTSLDQVNWQQAVDKDTGTWIGWQVDRFTPRQAKYIRFTCLKNSVNSIAAIVEFEVYSEAK
ncbi:MAG: DUF4855 domain-containing protein [Armatimonadota bacterium]